VLSGPTSDPRRWCRTNKAPSGTKGLSRHPVQVAGWVSWCLGCGVGGGVVIVSLHSYSNLLQDTLRIHSRLVQPNSVHHAGSEPNAADEGHVQICKSSAAIHVHDATQRPALTRGGPMTSDINRTESRPRLQRDGWTGFRARSFWLAVWGSFGTRLSERRDQGQHKPNDHAEGTDGVADEPNNSP